MRRIVLFAATLVTGLAMPAASAQATFHLEKVNEVMLASASGDASVRFVELLDKGGTEEQFTPVFAPYKLAVYDGAGSALGEQTLNPTGLRGAASAGTEYLISTAAADSAFGVTGDERLTISLPLGAAQVCFQGSPGNVSCITYGSITQPVPMSSNGTGSAHGPVPPNGQSDQRQGDDSIQAAPPTPKAPNRAGSSTPPGGGPAPPSGPANPGGGPTVPFAGVRFLSRAARVDRRGRALVSLSCPAGTSGRCSGHITLSAGRRHTRVGRASFALSSGGRRVIGVRLSAAALRTLARRGRLTVRASVAVGDGAGHSRTIASTLTLRR
jgi:hypothetical protein